MKLGIGWYNISEDILAKGRDSNFGVITEMMNSLRDIDEYIRKFKERILRERMKLFLK